MCKAAETLSHVYASYLRIMHVYQAPYLVAEFG